MNLLLSLMARVSLASSPIDGLLSKETFEKLTFNQKLAGSLIVVFQGMIIVFIVLLLILISTKIMSAVLADKKVSQPDLLATHTPHPEVGNLECSDSVTDEELVAVITAAVVAAEGTNNIVVSRIRKVKNHASNWNVAGIKETMNISI